MVFGRLFPSVSIRSIRLALFVATALCVAFVSHSVSAIDTVPATVSFQGRLVTSSGAPSPSGTYNMKLSLYDASSGGTQLWSSDRLVSAGQGVLVQNGLFSVRIGEVNPITASVFSSGDLYLEVELPTPATATTSSPVWTEGPMTPRNQLATSAYAFNSETLDGLDSADFAQLTAANTFTGATSVNVASANAFQVRNGATNLFNVDTSTSQIAIGASDTTGLAFVLDTKTSAGDPAITTNGAMYYNSNSGKFRCYQSGWKDCLSDLQSAYSLSTSPATITTTAAKGVRIAAGAAPTADIVTIDNTTNPVSTDDVNGIQVAYEGGSASVEGAGMRIDYAPGGTSASEWSGLRIASSTLGPASGVTAYGLKAEGPVTPGASSITGVRVAGGFGIGVDVASGGLQLSELANEPDAPAADALKIYAKEIAGRALMKVRGATGLDTPIQAALFSNNIVMMMPSTGTTINVWGMNSARTGTGSTPAIVAGDLSTSMRRARVTSAGTANASAELRSSQRLVWRGDAPGLGGFFYASRFSAASTVTNQQLFSGLTATTGATSATLAPSSIVNMVGVGWDSADTTLQVMCNSGSGTANKIDLGANFPANDTTAVYEAMFFSPANGSSIGYRISRLDTGDVASGTLVANLPTAVSRLTHHQYMNNGGTADSVVLDVNRVYVESDY